MHMLKRFSCGLLICVSGTLAHAQSGSSCELQLDETAREQWAYCSTWAPCKVAFTAMKACGEAQKFLDRVRSKVSSFFGKPKPLDAAIVFEAAVPEPEGRFQGEAAQKRSRIRETIKAGPKQVYELSNGAYVGEMVDGTRIGPGTYFLNDGRAYRGTYVNGQLEGLGEAATPDSGIARILGDFHDGLPDGDVLLRLKGGTQYSGRMDRGDFGNGNATIVYANGTTYEGSVEKGIRNGYGKVTSAGGSISGTYIDGKANGTMTVEKDGQTFTREFVNDAVVATTEAATTTSSDEPSSGSSMSGLLQGLAAGLNALQQAQQARRAQQPAATQKRGCNPICTAN